MARDAAEALRGRDVTHLVASPLQRAQETAAPMSEVLGLPIATDDRLIESSNHFEGKTFGVGDGALKHPANWPFLWNPFTPSWGEPYQVVAQRMLAAAEAARDAALGHEAVCVSHQLPIWTCRRWVEGRTALAPAGPAAVRAGVPDVADVGGRPAAARHLQRARRRRQPPPRLRGVAGPDAAGAGTDRCPPPFVPAATAAPPGRRPAASRSGPRPAPGPGRAAGSRAGSPCSRRRSGRCRAGPGTGSCRRPSGRWRTILSAASTVPSPLTSR